MNTPFLFSDPYGATVRQPPTVERRRLVVFGRARSATSHAINAFAAGMPQARRMLWVYRELKAMNEQELEDIGISRSGIPAVVTGTYPRMLDSISDSTSRAERQRSPSPARREQTGRPRSLSMTSATAPNIVDVRSLVPAQRHQKIFQLVNDLAPGASFILVNDHDPKPLYYQLEAEYPKQFSWTYCERGPEVWQVEISKLGQAT